MGKFLVDESTTFSKGTSPWLSPSQSRHGEGRRVGLDEAARAGALSSWLVRKFGAKYTERTSKGVWPGGIAFSLGGVFKGTWFPGDECTGLLGILFGRNLGNKELHGK